MGLTPRPGSRIRAVWALLGLALALGAAQAWQLQRLQHWNALLRSGAQPADPGLALPPELRFAQAAALAASGADELALNRYRALQDDTPLGLAARYNSANLLLRQGLVLRESRQPGQALAPIELAKEMYREVLRVDPEHWDARYNLERAQRLLPDPEAAGDTTPEPQRNAERAATTMRGYSPGQP